MGQVDRCEWVDRTDVNRWIEQMDRCEQVDRREWVDRWNRWIDRRDRQMRKAAKTNSRIKESQD